MTRRDLFKAITGVAVLSTTATVGHQASVSYGPMDVMRCWRYRKSGLHLHVFVHGEDVSMRCRFADDTPGQQRAELFKFNEHGRIYRDPLTHTPVMEIVTSGVSIRPGVAFR